MIDDNFNKTPQEQYDDLEQKHQAAIDAGKDPEEAGLLSLEEARKRVEAGQPFGPFVVSNKYDKEFNGFVNISDNQAPDRPFVDSKEYDKSFNGFDNNIKFSDNIPPTGDGTKGELGDSGLDKEPEQGHSK